MQRIRIKFNKGPEVKFISHLDLMRCFERAVRRTDIPIAYSEGRNPRMRMAWGPPLQLGIESVCELADLDIDGWIKPNDLMAKINGVLPRGVEITEANLGDPKARSLSSVMNRAEYIIRIDCLDPTDLGIRISDVLRSEKIEIEKDGKVANKRRLLHALSLKEEKEITMLAEIGERGTLKPSEILKLLGSVKICKIIRTKLFSS